jgi:hypothetical protein
VSALPELPEVHHPERGLKKDGFDTRDSRTLLFAETTFYDQGKLDYDIVKARMGLSVLYEPEKVEIVSTQWQLRARVRNRFTQPQIIGLGQPIMKPQ